MKRVLFALLPLTGAAILFSQNNKGVIEGHVLRTTTSEPISGVLVTLTPPIPTPSNLSPEAAQALSDQLERQRLLLIIGGQGRETSESIRPPGESPNDPVFVLTDVSGSFSFRDLAPGRYTVRAAGRGHLGPMRNGSYLTGVQRTVDVEGGKTSGAIDLRMIPGVIVTGKVFDPFGQPAPNIPVVEYRVIHTNGREVWAQGGSTITDDRGDWRIGVTAPGELYVAATPRGGPGPQESWVRTYYPSATEPENAVKISAPDGSETNGLNLNIQTRRDAWYRISGRAINPQATPNQVTGVVDQSVSTFYLVPRKPSVFAGTPTVSNAIPVGSRPNGEFEIRNVVAGSYDLIAYAADQATRRLSFARTPVEVRNEDVTGLSLAISPGLPLTGEIQVRGSGADTLKLGRVSILVQSMGPLPFNLGISTTTATFSAERLPAERLRIEVQSGVPPTAYVADIRQAGASVFDTGFELNDKLGPVQIIVDTDGQIVTGIVHNAKGDPFEMGTVVLVPPEGQRQNSMRYKTGAVDAAGRFTIRGVPPNRYTIYAWENIFPSAWLNEKYVSKYQDRGRPLTVTVGSRNDVQVEGIPTGN